MRGFWSGLAMAIALAAITAGGVVITQDDPPPEGGFTTANLWIDSTGGTCTYSSTAVEWPNDGTECDTFDEAYDAIRTATGATCGGRVLIKAGTYGPETMTGYRSNCPTTEAGQTLFAPESFDCDLEEYPTSDTPVLFTGDGVSTGDGENAGASAAVGHVTLCGLTWPISTTQVTNASGTATDNSRHGFGLVRGSRYLTVKRSRFGGFAVFKTGYNAINTGSGHFDLLYNWIGPCHEYGVECGGNGKLDIVEFSNIEGNYFNYFRALDNCTPLVECGHHEPMFVNGVKGLNIKRNRFWNWEQSGAVFLTCSGPDIAAIAGGQCLRDTVIENNWFESPHNAQAGAQEPNESGEWGESAARPSNSCAVGGADSLENIVIRNNTVLGALTFVGVANCGIAGAGVSITGNIANRITSDGGCSLAGLTMDYNIGSIYATNGDNSCGANRHNGTLASSFLVDPAWASATQDIHQIPGSSIVDAFVPEALCPDEDYDGDPRPAGSCDAGADED